MSGEPREFSACPVCNVMITLSNWNWGKCDKCDKLVCGKCSDSKTVRVQDYAQPAVVIQDTTTMIQSFDSYGFHRWYCRPCWKK